MQPSADIFVPSAADHPNTPKYGNTIEEGGTCLALSLRYLLWSQLLRQLLILEEGHFKPGQVFFGQFALCWSRQELEGEKVLPRQGKYYWARIVSWMARREIA